MINIEDCISLSVLSESLAFMTPSRQGKAVPQIDFDEVPSISEDDFAKLHAYVLDSISDVGGTSFLSTFNSFEGFYDWLDTVEHYEQEDSGTSITHLPWLALIFLELKRGYQYVDADQARHGSMICASCSDHILTGQYRVSELPDAYIVEHRECCEHDPAWVVVDKEKQDKKANAAEYVQACKAFQLKWNTTALDDEIAHYSV